MGHGNHGAHDSHQQMDHSEMNHEDINHEGMDHEGMDHESMDHENTASIAWWMAHSAYPPCPALKSRHKKTPLFSGVFCNINTSSN
jgi:uncharacterized protein involved in copper resistance